MRDENHVLGWLTLFLPFAWLIYILVRDASRDRSLRQAEAAARERADRQAADQARLARREQWFNVTEPQFRSSSRYPPDWEIRRAVVFLRACGRCEECGERVGELICDENAIWDYDLPDKRLREAHIHHILRLSNGGDHSLDNLSLLCQNCHIAEHPNNVLLTGARPAETARSMRLDPERVVIRKARTNWTCSVCRLPIQPGQKYADGKWCAVCERCFKLFFPDVAELPKWS